MVSKTIFFCKNLELYGKTSLQFFSVQHLGYSRGTVTLSKSELEGPFMHPFMLGAGLSVCSLVGSHVSHQL